MIRETATDLAQMPHAFDGAGRECALCTASVDDERHTAYERVETASRETAAEQQSTNFRELGS